MTDAGADAFPWIAARDRTGEETPAVAAYLGYLRDRPDSILGALRDIAHAPGATVVHCAAGKDRTGVVCMLALAVAGATREAIVADFLATGDRIAPLMTRLRRSPTYGPDLRGRADEAHAPRPETIARVLDVLDAPTAARSAGSTRPASARTTPRRCAGGSGLSRRSRRSAPRTARPAGRQDHEAPRGHVDRSHEDLAAQPVDPRHERVEVVDPEVGQPGRLRRVRVGEDPPVAAVAVPDHAVLAGHLLELQPNRSP